MKSKLKNSETSLVNPACVSAAEEEDETKMNTSGVRVLKSSSIEIERDIVSSLPEVTVKAIATTVAGLNNLNRTHSNSSCNSDSDYNSITNSTLSASCSSPLIDSKAPSINSSIGLQCTRVIAGFYGKSKTLVNINENICSNSNHESDQLLTSSISNTNNNSEEVDSDSSDSNDVTINTTNYNGGSNFFINYGDDVGFMMNQSNITNKSEYTYFGIADGVSANRLRGYDARLFPIALLSSCVRFIKEYRDLPENKFKIEQQQQMIVRETVQKASGLSVILLDHNENIKTNERELEEKEEDEEKLDYLGNKCSNDNDKNQKEVEEAEENDENNEEKSNIDDENEREDDEEDYIIQANDANPDEGILSSSSSDETSSSLDCKYLYNILVEAHERVQEQKIYGSSTVCLLSLRFMEDDEFDDIVGEDEDENSSLPGRFRASHRSSLSNRCVLSTLNLGDSGYMIIRNKQVVFKSQSQSHRFNAPYQIGCTPPELLDHDLYRDSAEDSISMTHRLETGDFLIISSDGLFDNLYEDEIALLVDKHISEYSSRSSPSSLSSMMASVEEDVGEAENSLASATPSNSSTNKTMMHQQISSELLSSTCELLVERASLAGIKKDDMLIMLIYIN